MYVVVAITVGIEAAGEGRRGVRVDQRDRLRLPGQVGGVDARKNSGQAQMKPHRSIL